MSSERGALKPPKGYRSWLAYAIATMDTRSLHLESIVESSHWGRTVDRDEMYIAARNELKSYQELKMKKTERDEVTWEREIGDVDMSYDFYDWFNVRSVLFAIETVQLKRSVVRLFNACSRDAYERLFGHL